jgi:hypothetical protein
LTRVLAAVFFVISFIFVYRSFYSMRIGTEEVAKEPIRAAAD